MHRAVLTLCLLASVVGCPSPKQPDLASDPRAKGQPWPSAKDPITRIDTRLFVGFDAGNPSCRLGAVPSAELAAITASLATRAPTRAAIAATTLGELTLTLSSGATLTLSLVFDMGRERYRDLVKLETTDGPSDLALPAELETAIDSWRGKALLASDPTTTCHSKKGSAR